jgi:hypothetical protein
MRYVNSLKRRQSIQRTTGIQYDQYGFSDAFSIAAEETIRSLPTASIFRGVNNLFDSSEKIDPLEANQKFSLEGEAAFTPEDEDVTVSMAAARAEDQSRLARNAHIQGLYAQESPVGAITANVAGSLTAGFLDPVTAGLNLGAGFAITKGIQAAITSTRVGRAGLNALGSFSPKAGQAVIQMYNTKASQTLTSVLMREGAENFLASIAEESVNFVGIGEDRLARKITVQESLRNIVIGTTFGTGFGTILDRGGRRGIVNRMNRLFGDKAPENTKAINQTAAMEVKAGVPEGTHIQRQLDQETFSPKTWHEHADDGVDYVNSPNEGKFFIPVDKDQVHGVSNRGDSLVLTSNVSHAQNLGDKVKQIDVSQHKMLKPDDFKGKDGRKNKLKNNMVNKLTDDLLDGATPEQLQGLMSKLLGDQFKGKISILKIRKALKQELMDKESVDDVLEALEGLSTSGALDYNAHAVIRDVLDEAGFDGYTFTGKNSDGGRAYTGVALTPNGAKKAKTADEFEVKKPDFTEKESYKLTQQKSTEDYMDTLHNIAKTREKVADEEMLPEELVSPEEIEAGDFNARNVVSEEYQKSKVVKESVDKAIENLEIKSADKKLSMQDEQKYQLLNAIKNNNSFDEMADDVAKKIKLFDECMKG